MINILPTAEQQQIVDSVVEVLARECPVDRLRKVQSPMMESEARRRFGELGWFRFGLPEAAGGNGFGLAEETLVFREFGRFLLSPALAAASLAACLAAESGQAAVSDSIAGGNSVPGIALPARAGTFVFGADGILSGDLLLIDAHDAEWVMLVEAGGAALFRQSDLSEKKNLQPLDGATTLARGRADNVVPLVWQAASAPSSAYSRALLLLSAQLVGVAEACRNMAAGYAKLRTQFGKPIGAMQAVAHYCADMAVRADAAYCQTLFAAIALREQRPDAVFQVAAANLVACDAALQNATMNIRVHGGIGFTADCHAQRYLKRAVVLRQLAGGTGAQDAELIKAEVAIE